MDLGYIDEYEQSNFWPDIGPWLRRDPVDQL